MSTDSCMVKIYHFREFTKMINKRDRMDDNDNNGNETVPVLRRACGI